MSPAWQVDSLPLSHLGSSLSVIYAQIFYIQNGKVYDSTFCEASSGIANQVIASKISSVDYTSFTENELYNFIIELQNGEQYGQCLQVMYYGIAKFDSRDFAFKVYPKIASCLRKQKKPEEVIEFYNINKQKISSLNSTAFFTSLAAAYCDLGFYENALKCAKRAYAISKGVVGIELQFVFERIKNNTDL